MKRRGRINRNSDMRGKTRRQEQGGQQAASAGEIHAVPCGENPVSGAEEEKLEEKIRSITSDTEVPEKLQPEAVEQLLAEERQLRRRRNMWKYTGATAAACLCLAVGITAGYGAFGAKEGKEEFKGSGMGVSQDTEKETEGAASQAAVCAGNYDEIYGYVKAASQDKYMKFNNTGAVEEAADISAATASGMSAKDGADSRQNTAGDYSDTNVREEGVKEGDVVKTDGKYLYIMERDKISIVGIEDATMEKTAEISPGEEGYFSELYVEDGLLAAVYSDYMYAEDSDSQDSAGLDGGSPRTNVYVYDVRDAAQPELAGAFSQSGYYNTMRIKDGYVYLISSFYAGMPSEPAAREEYIPQVQGKLLEPGDICIPQSQSGRAYTLISSFALNAPEKETDSVAVLGGSGQCYVSGKNIYVTEGIYESSETVTQTSVRRISYSGGDLAVQAQTKVDGTLHDSFSIDEYGGYLRLVTTVEPVYAVNDGVQPLAETGNAQGDTAAAEETAVETNSLYVLDEALEVVGEIHDLAPEESVYSARFMGDTGYFVTFEEIDPLFSVDLSDPENPEIIGALKIPGFSEYLHPYGEGRLLGIGMDVDGETAAVQGVKLSMFDISNPADVQETAVCVLEDTYGTDVSYNYKAAFVDTEKNLFGFTAYSADSTWYYIFTFDGAGFQQVFKRELSGYGESRGLYAGERFYIVCGSTVESFTMDGFEKVDDIVL